MVAATGTMDLVPFWRRAAICFGPTFMLLRMMNRAYTAAMPGVKSSTLPDRADAPAEVRRLVKKLSFNKASRRKGRRMTTGIIMERQPFRMASPNLGTWLAGRAWIL